MSSVQQQPPPTVIHLQQQSSSGLYPLKSSICTGITLIVLGVLLFVLAIAEVCIPRFPSAGAMFAIFWISVMAGSVGVYAGCKARNSSAINASLCITTFAAVMNGLLCLFGMIARIIVELIIIPLSESEGPNYDYIFHHTYFANGSIEEYDYDDPEVIPIDKPYKHVDYLATGIIFGLELLLLFVAMIIAIVQAAFACRTKCRCCAYCCCCAGGPYEGGGGYEAGPAGHTATVMVMQPDGTLVEVTAAQMMPLQQEQQQQQPPPAK